MCHIELEQRMARGQRHISQIGNVPRTDDVPARIRHGLDGVDHSAELVDMAATRCRPGPPLVAVDGAQLTVGIGPLIPDRHSLLVQPLDIGRALNEPQQLGDDRPGVKLLGREQRKTLTQVEAHLVAKRAQCPGAGAVTLLGAVCEDVVQQVEVGLHGSSLLSYDGQHELADGATGSNRRSSATTTGRMARTARPRWLIASLMDGSSSPLVIVYPLATNSGS